ILYTIDYLCFFFFQAEDGIRDGHVTGVQTCALPIYMTFPYVLEHAVAGSAETETSYLISMPLVSSPFLRDPPKMGAGAARTHERSEERRVGKECRCRGWA